ncbi:MAG: hypothetical protein ACK4TL_12690 [Hyphomicrobiaceae bacterium]
MTLRFVALVRSLAIVLTMVGGTQAAAQDPADTSKIPRPKGANVIYESPQTTIFSVSLSVEAAAKAVEAVLRAADWQGYADPSGRSPVDPQARHVVVRKGPTGLRVRIAPAPGQGNATTINYVSAPLRHDIPFPPDGSDIKFDPNVPHLEAVTGQSFDEISKFYVTQMQERGWALHQPSDGSSAFAGDGVSQRAFLTKSGQRPLLLFMRRQDAGGVAVKLEAVSPRLLPGAEAKRPQPPAPKAAAREETSDIEKQVESLVGDVLRDVQKQLQGIGAASDIDKLARIREAPSLPDQPAARSPRERPAARQPASAAPSRASVNPPIPLPERATNQKFDATRGTFEFKSPLSVEVLADFYRSELTQAGWTLTPKGINRPTMIGLVFEREDTSLTVTVARIGNATHVMAQGDALVSAKATGDDAMSKARTEAGRAQAHPVLEVMESHGLPVPRPNSSVGRVTSLFRYEAMAVVPAPAEAVLAFYRKELAARGWKEVGQVQRSDATTAAEFNAPDGPARLTLLSKGDETHITLAVRKEAEARKSGLLPKPGMARLLFGSLPDVAGKVSIAGRTIDVPAGVGTKGTDGPSIELKPGAHRVVVRIAGKPPFEETITIGANEIWGLLIGPNGGLPLQAY